MIGLGFITSFEGCLDFLKENPGFNGIISIRLFLAPDKIYKEYFACDRFESFFDGLLLSYDETAIKEIFNEPFSEIEISYRLLPCGKRTEPLTTVARMSKEQIRQIKDLNIDISRKIFEALYKELLYALVEGK